MFEVSDDIDNFTCEICMHGCPSDHEYLSHTNLCREIRKETYSKKGCLDINKTGIHVLYEKFVNPVKEYGELPSKVINVKNIEKLLFRKLMPDGTKDIEYKILLQRDIINSMRKVIRRLYANNNKLEQAVIVSYFTGLNLRYYRNGKWHDDENGKQFKKDIVDKLIDQYKDAIKEVLDRFEEIANGDYSKFDVVIDDERLKKMIANRHLDFRIFNKIIRSYNKALELMDGKTLPDRVLHIMWQLFHVDVFGIRKAIITNQKKSDQDASSTSATTATGGEVKVKNV